MSFSKFVTFSYDDGVLQDERLIKIFNAYGIKGTFNLNSGLMPAGSYVNERIPREKISEIYKGHEIASHGRFHPRYNLSTYEEMEADIADDIEDLSFIAGYRVRGFAYPYGTYVDDTVAILKKHGIEYARCVGSTELSADIRKPLELIPTCHHSYEKIFDVIDSFDRAEPDGSDILLYIWGHAYEFDLNSGFNTWEHIENVCKALSGLKNCSFVTNIEYFDHLKKEA